ncbi:hypothetical protein D3C77_557110 [compost metagenome]
MAIGLVRLCDVGFLINSGQRKVQAVLRQYASLELKTIDERCSIIPYRKSIHSCQLGWTRYERSLGYCTAKRNALSSSREEITVNASYSTSLSSHSLHGLSSCHLSFFTRHHIKMDVRI